MCPCCKKILFELIHLGALLGDQNMNQWVIMRYHHRKVFLTRIFEFYMNLCYSKKIVETKKEKKYAKINVKDDDF